MLSKPKLAGLVVCLLVVCLAVFVPGGGEGPLNPDPGPDHQPTDVVAQVFDNWESGFRDLFRESAGKLESGEITDRAEIMDFEHKGLLRTGNEAMKPLWEMDQSDLSPDVWRAETHAALRRRLADVND